MNMPLKIIIGIGVFSVFFYFGGVAIWNLRLVGVVPPVNGSVSTIKTIEARINENFLQGGSLIYGRDYLCQYFYSGYRFDAGSGAVAVFSAVNVSNMGGATPMQFYVHLGESFMLYGKNYTLKAINVGSVTLEVVS